MKKNTITAKSKIFGYVRVSSASQIDNHSLETQKALIIDYCLRNRFITDTGDDLMKLRNLILWIEDKGVSASKVATRNRQGFKTILTDGNEGDIVVAAKLDRIFRSVGDACLCMETLKSASLELHIVDRGCVTNGDASQNLQLNVLNAVAQFDGELKSSRVREVKEFMAANHLWMGGRRKRGFVPERIGNKVFAVASISESKILEQIAKIKLERDLKLKESGQNRLSKSSNCSMSQVQERLEKYAKKHGFEDSLGKFKTTTLYNLLTKEDSKGVMSRLAQIKDSSKKLIRVDGQLVIARDLAKTSRQDAGIDGGKGKQLSLFQAGLKTKQKVSPGIKMRHVKKSESKLVKKIDGAKRVSLL